MTADQMPGPASWQRAEDAAAALAVDPHGLGGINLRACPGPIRETWLAGLRELLPSGTPWRTVPLHASEARLLGGIDLAATLSAGSPVAESGLLAEASGGVVLLAMAERASRTTVAHLCAALDRGELVLERDGLQGRFASRIAVVALDEGLDHEEPAESLLDRLALAVDLHQVGIHDVGDPRFSSDDIEEARRVLPAVTCTQAQLQTLAGVAAALGVDSPRALLLANRAARAIAALAGRQQVDDEDLSAAATLALAHRATRFPLSEEPDEVPDDPPQEEDPAPDGETKEQAAMPETPPERLLEAAAAAIPPGLLARLQSGTRRRRSSASQGKSGAQQRHRLRGRPAGVMPGDPRGGARLNLVATLRAAAPWQKLRRHETGNGGVVVQRQDFRLVRYRHRTESTTIFVVDASGSAALHRLAEAKGAVELLLADCYVRRDQVALVAFRGSGAELLLPPTRSLVRARRSLGSLPGGGGTPLASAIDMTTALADQVQRRGGTPCYVLLTDGRANICRDGRRGRDEAMREALASGAGLRQMAVQGMVIDTSPRPHGGARDLAEAMDAIYLALPRADAASLRDAVQANAR